MQLAGWGIGRGNSSNLIRTVSDAISPRWSLSGGDTTYPHVWHERLVHISHHVMRLRLLLHGSHKVLCTSHASSQSTTIYCAPTMSKMFRWRGWHENRKSDRVWWKLSASLEQMWSKSLENELDQSTELACPSDFFVLHRSQNKGLGARGEVAALAPAA